MRPRAIREIPDSRTQGPGRGENFVPFRIKTLDRGGWPISKKSEFKGGMICVNFMMAALFVLPIFGARAEDTFKIAWIDPLSGGGASVGEKRPEGLSVHRR